MMRRVVITGYDVICSLGNDSETVHKGLKQGNAPLCDLGENAPGDEFIHIKVGKVKGISAEPEDSNGYDKSEVMAVRAYDGAMKNAGLCCGYGGVQPERVSLSLATSIMGSEHIIEYVRGGDIDYIGRSKLFEVRLADKFGIGGEIYTTSSACASGTAAVGMAVSLIRSGKSDIVVCCCTDHISSLSLNGFMALETLSKGVCKPFDKTRNGINIGEGCACFIIEDYESAQKRGANIQAEIVGYGLANDACHITSPDPEGIGALSSMKMAAEDNFSRKKLKDNDKIYFNTHGTGTVANDAMELKAIRTLMGDRGEYAISSTKSLTGHCLGAAGGVELALGLMMLKDGKVYQTQNSNTDMDENYNANKEIDSALPPNYLLSNSFAFGGNDATIAVRTYEG